MDPDELYQRLLPPLPTPPDELCGCGGEPPVKLMEALGYNPLHCLDCNLEVPPGRLALPPEVIDAVADWRAIYAAIDGLWLDSREYEGWAAAELSDLNSAVNRRGRDVQRRVDPFRRCYYLCFQDQSAEDYRPFDGCPACGAPLLEHRTKRLVHRICEPCSLVGWGE